MTVTDTGCGIASEHLRTIFDPFVQVGPSREGAHTGSGLGLAISQDLAQQRNTWATSPSRASSESDRCLPSRSPALRRAIQCPPDGRDPRISAASFTQCLRTIASTRQERYTRQRRIGSHQPPRSSAVLLDRLFNARAALGEILQRHGRPHCELRIEREKERLRNGGQLRRLLHVEEDVAVALAIVFGEIGRFGLELAEYLLERGAKRSFPYRVIASLNRES